jgi:tetratricopeptide (TPR) repeat protein
MMRRPFLLLTAALLSLAITALWHASTQPVTSSAPAPAPAELSDEAMLARLRLDLQANPGDPQAYARLGLALLQRVRQTADVTLYDQAQSAFDEALRLDAEHVDALVGQGVLALARHDFQAALVWGQRAQALDPYRAESVGIIVDAQVELGQYPEALASTQAMVDLRPDLRSYSRVAYLRELHGDTAGAIAAMQAAVRAGVPSQEGTLWAQTQLGHLYFNSGDWPRAAATYRQALRLRPDYPYALAGLARVLAAQGQPEEAIAALSSLTQRLPLPEFVIPLGELYEVTGQPDQAARQYALVRVIQQLNTSAGLDVDLELALFEAEHGGDPQAAVEQARQAYARRPSILAADVLAWALYQAEDYQAAQVYAREALRLGTQDAAKFYHAGMIADRLGDWQQAQAYLQHALDINPQFSIREAGVARQTLEALRRVRQSSLSAPQRLRLGAAGARPPMVFSKSALRARGSGVAEATNFEKAIRPPAAPVVCPW